MTTYTKTILIIAGLILIPAIFISQNYISADYINLSTNTSSTSNPPISDTNNTTNPTSDNLIYFPGGIVLDPYNLDPKDLYRPISDQDDSDVPDNIPTLPGVIVNPPTSNPDNNQPPPNTFLFFDTNIFPNIEDWSKIIPNIILPPIDIDEPQTMTIASLFKSWQDIKDKPIGIIVDESEQTKIFEERKQIFDAWFEKEWQKIIDPITDCDNWWCMDNPPAWTKTTAYTLTKFDFSYDWAWNQFSKDYL